MISLTALQNPGTGKPVTDACHSIIGDLQTLIPVPVIWCINWGSCSIRAQIFNKWLLHTQWQSQVLGGCICMSAKRIKVHNGLLTNGVNFTTNTSHHLAWLSPYIRPRGGKFHRVLIITAISALLRCQSYKPFLPSCILTKPLSIKCLLPLLKQERIAYYAQMNGNPS